MSDLVILWTSTPEVVPKNYYTSQVVALGRALSNYLSAIHVTSAPNYRAEKIRLQNTPQFWTIYIHILYIVPSKFSTFFQTMNCIPVTPPAERELDRRNRNCHDSSWHQWTEPCWNAEADRSDRLLVTISHFPLGHKQTTMGTVKKQWTELPFPQADWPQVSVCRFSWVPIVAIGYL